MGGKSDTPAPTQTSTYTLSPEQRQLMDLAMPGLKSFAATVPAKVSGLYGCAVYRRADGGAEYGACRRRGPGEYS
jgi:hypothetical protein